MDVVDETVRTGVSTSNSESSDSDPRTLGRRCTAHLEAGRYPDALSDAKALVRLLPDAPIGYLKAARCYRLLKKLKASARMLDAATERAADESTLKAVRTEMRKLQQDEQAQQEARNRPFADSLPEEIFIEIISYLSQSERVRAAQVNKTWRMVLHSHTTLWTTMYLNVNGHGSSKQQSERLRAQIAFYEARLPEKRRRDGKNSMNAGSRGASALECLSIHGVKLIEDTSNDLRRFVGSVSLPAHRLVRSLAAISLSNASPHTCEWLYSRLEGVKTLRSVRIACPHHNLNNLLGTWFENYISAAEAISIRRDATSAQSDPDWPYLSNSPIQLPTPRAGLSPRKIGPGPSRGLRHLYLQASGSFGVPVPRDSPKEAHPDSVTMLPASAANRLETLYLGGGGTLGTGRSLLCLETPLQKLRTLSLYNVILEMIDLKGRELQTLSMSDIFNTEESRPAIEFPELRELNIHLPDGRRLPGTQYVPPHAVLSVMQAPKLRSVLIENSGTIYGGRPPLDPWKCWVDFCRASSSLRALVLPKTGIPDDELLESLPLLSNLEKLVFTHIKLPLKFLVAAASPNLPALQHLGLSHCTNIASGDLLRLVQSKNGPPAQSSSSKNGQLSYLDIEGCMELHKEAVDWLKANVKTVVWKGWKDPKEPKAFSFR